MTENNINNNIENKILQKIKDENLRPKSLWYFLVKDYSLWSMVFVSVILAALSIAPIIFIIQNLELGYVKHITNNPYTFVFFILPYPWIILCCLTTYLATLAWEKTSHGYRFPGTKVFVCSLLTSLALGVVLNMWNFGRRVDDEFHTASFGNYKSFAEKRNEFWFNPSEGRIIGAVTNIGSTTFVIFNSPNNFTKEIVYDNTIPGTDNLEIDNHIRVVGYSDTDEDGLPNFIACAIFSDQFEPQANSNHRNLPPNLSTGSSTFLHPECQKIFEQGRASFRPRINR
jgi:hypothetical protein